LEEREGCFERHRGRDFLKLIEEEVCNKESYGERLRREETKQQRTTRHQR
jgi:hypothetical protein